MAQRKKTSGGACHLISGKEDMRWLRDAHLPRLSSKYKAALLCGNEDAPTRVEVYKSANPSIKAQKIVYKVKGARGRLKRAR